MKTRLRVLLVEDNDDDVSLMQRAIERTGTPIDLVVVSDGHEATRYLSRTGGYVDAAQPDLVLLDINTPKKNGLEVLQEWNKLPKTVPVIVVTTSEAADEVAEAYAAGAACFVSKPQDFVALKELVHALFAFWRFSRIPEPGGRR